MQKVSMYTIKTINMINCSLYMNNDSSYVILACDNAEVRSVSRRTKYYLLMMVMYCLVITTYIVVTSIHEVFCFVNLNGNMVVVGNKFFPLWRHFQKFHTNRCQAHLTITGVLKRTKTCNTSTLLMV